MELDCKTPWQPPISKQQWKDFLNFSFADKDRPIIYQIISEYTSNNNKPTLAEIGFGQCYDFQQCFKQLHDTGELIYSGIDITEQFVNYAKSEYPNHDFKTQNFYSYDQPAFDITYTRGTLEYQAPSKLYESLENLLKRTNNLCIISWFIPPETHSIQWVNDGFNNVGAYVNTYDYKLTKEIIEKHGFQLKIHVANGCSGNILHIYELRK
jgi:hypothetical protein